MHLFHYNYNRIHNSPILHVIVTRAYQLSFIDTYFLLSALCVCVCASVCMRDFAFGGYMN